SKNDNSPHDDSLNKFRSYIEANNSCGTKLPLDINPPEAVEDHKYNPTYSMLEARSETLKSKKRYSKRGNKIAPACSPQHSQHSDSGNKIRNLAQNTNSGKIRSTEPEKRFSSSKKPSSTDRSSDSIQKGFERMKPRKEVLSRLEWKKKFDRGNVRTSQNTRTRKRVFSQRGLESSDRDEEHERGSAKRSRNSKKRRKKEEESTRSKRKKTDDERQKSECNLGMIFLYVCLGVVSASVLQSEARYFNSHYDKRTLDLDDPRFIKRALPMGTNIGVAYVKRDDIDP
ncbi:hypothetical protein TELCIR_10049, partial [Teladorsagia circumcincta]